MDFGDPLWDLYKEGDLELCRPIEFDTRLYTIWNIPLAAF